MSISIGLPFNSFGVAISSKQSPEGSTSHTGHLRWGYDFSLGVGTPIIARETGRVVSYFDGFPSTGVPGKEDSGIGNFVTIVFNEGTAAEYYATYAHLSQDSTNIPDDGTISEGDIIALSGASGNNATNSGPAYSPHLHVHFSSGDPDKNETNDDTGLVFFQSAGGSGGWVANGLNDNTNPIAFPPQSGTVINGFPTYVGDAPLPAPISADGPDQTKSGPLVDANGSTTGVVSIDAPTFMVDGNAEYTVSLAGVGRGLQYNIAFIIDASGSMVGQRIVDAKNAYIELTNQLIDLGIGDVANFAVIPFNSGSTLYADLSAEEAINRIALLSAGGGTSFGPALANAEVFFSSANTGQTNIAYFLSDGQGSGASNSLANIANVQAFGIGAGANLSSLNIIDSDNAVSLSSSAQLVDVLTSSSIDVSEIGRIDITLDGQVVETITRDQLVNGPLGLQFTGTLIRLDVTPSAQNLVNAAVYFTDGVKSGEVDLLIASALNNTSVVSNGTTSNVTFGAFSTFFDADAIGASNVNLLANNLGNNIVATNTGGSFSLFGGDDFILSSQTAGSTIDRVIDGGDGFDVVQYVENFIQNAASKIGNVLKIGSNSDTLSNVEEVRFADAILDVESFSVRFLTTGTDDSDYLTGTSNADEIRSLAGSYDRMVGGLGEDVFVFGAETSNGLRERDLIEDYEVGIDSIRLEAGASVASIRETSSAVVVFLEGDNDAIYVRGGGVTKDNLDIVDDGLFVF